MLRGVAACLVRRATRRSGTDVAHVGPACCYWCCVWRYALATRCAALTLRAAVRQREVVLALLRLKPGSPEVEAAGISAFQVRTAKSKTSKRNLHTICARRAFPCV